LPERKARTFNVLVSGNCDRFFASSSEEPGQVELDGDGIDLIAPKR